MKEGTATAKGMIMMDNPSSKPNLMDIDSEALHLSSETLEKYIPAPSKGIILQDVLIGLKRFWNVVQWKWFWIEEAKKTEMDMNGLVVGE